MAGSTAVEAMIEDEVDMAAEEGGEEVEVAFATRDTSLVCYLSYDQHVCVSYPNRSEPSQ